MQATSSFELTPSLCNGDLCSDLADLVLTAANAVMERIQEMEQRVPRRQQMIISRLWFFFNGASATIQTTASRRGGLHSVNNDSLTWRDWFIWLFLLIVTMICFFSFLNLEVLVLILVIIKLGAVEIMYVLHCPCRISYHPTDHKTVLPRCGLCK